MKISGQITRFVEPMKTYVFCDGSTRLQPPWIRRWRGKSSYLSWVVYSQIRPTLLYANIYRSTQCPDDIRPCSPCFVDQNSLSKVSPPFPRLLPLQNKDNNNFWLSLQIKLEVLRFRSSLVFLGRWQQLTPPQAKLNRLWAFRCGSAR